MNEYTKQDQSLEVFPAVPSAYDFVIPSYNWMLSRYEAANSGIQTLLGYVTTLTFALPALAISTGKKLQFCSLHFYIAIALFLLIIITGLVVRLWGHITFLDPGTLFGKSLHLSEFEFKKDCIYFAGKHFDSN